MLALSICLGLSHSNSASWAASVAQWYIYRVQDEWCRGFKVHLSASHFSLEKISKDQRCYAVVCSAVLCHFIHLSSMSIKYSWQCEYKSHTSSTNSQCQRCSAEYSQIPLSCILPAWTCVCRERIRLQHAFKPVWCVENGQHTQCNPGCNK